jgi:predicted AlkP superfamily pyrophosphatase or phosphodiesterase
VRAEGLIPVFPSKTFPNHYSIVTGLYAGNHGIVSNNMRDAKLGEFHLSDREAVQNSGWWGGEPLWVTAHRAGLITAAMFWPGTEAPVGGVQPDFWRPFDSEFPFEQRVEQVLEWLALPSGERPRFITLYFQEPDGSNHRFGPLSEEAHHAIARVDAQIGALRDGIATLGADQRVDLIVVSDHGMADVHSDRMIVIDELVDFEPGELFETGALVQVFPKPGRETLLFEALRNADPHLKVYRREELPASFHLGGSDRIAPLVGVPDVGWEAVTALRRTAQRAGPLGGHHGPDPADQRMHGLFVAGGPSIASGVTLPRFENVHIYEFVCSLLGIEPAPNDGDPAVLRSLVRRSPPTLR